MEAGAGGKDWTGSCISQSKDFGFYSRALGSPWRVFHRGVRSNLHVQKVPRLLCGRVQEGKEWS